MLIKRSIPIILEPCGALSETVEEFNRYQKSISEEAFNKGSPASAVSLHKQVYYTVASSLSAQLRCSAIRVVAGAYTSAKSNKRLAQRPFIFRRKRALFLIGKRGRDASFSKDGKLSISTVAGRRKIGFRIPPRFLDDFEKALTKDSLSVGSDGKGVLCITLQVEDPLGNIPVGVDVGIKNAVVASTTSDTLIISGNNLAKSNKCTRKTKARIQSKKSSKKELGKDSRSVRRVLKSLSRKQRNRTKTFCRETAAKLCKWAPKNAVLVFEDLHIKKVTKKEHARKGTRRKLNSFFYRSLIQSVTNRAERDGIAITYVDPAYTSQICNRCGVLGIRFGSRFVCPHCELKAHADVNASLNVLTRFAVLRGGGPLSTGLEARASATGKLSPLGESS